MDFNGTSSAAPHVAGIAALMLSVNPNLTQQQVNSIIQSTANRYPSRHNEYGYGLVNAFKATSEASTIANGSISGPGSQAVYANATFNVSATLSTGAVFKRWSITPGTYSATNGLASPTLDVVFTSPGTQTLTAHFTLPDGTAYTVSKTVNVTGSSYTITGPSDITLNAAATYQAASPVSGCTFTDWTIHPDTYTASGSTTNQYLYLSSFNTPGWYTVKAEYLLPNGKTHSVKKVVTVAGAYGTPDIIMTGPHTNPRLGFNEAFSVPAPPTGARFDRWTVTPDTPYHYHFADASYLNYTKIGFRQLGDMTVTANYTMADGSTYSVVKAITVVPPFDAEIIGPDNPTQGTPVNYETAPDAPAGWEFLGWNVYTWSGRLPQTPRPALRSFLTSDPVLTHTFTASGNYIIYARYTLPNGNGFGSNVLYDISKIVTAD